MKQSERIYFDNGSTSFPKAPGMGGAVGDFIDRACVNVGRGGYADAYAVQDMVFDTRERLGALFGCSQPKNIAFTLNITHALNTLLKGYLRAGQHVIISSMEHNAVMRPLYELQQQGVQYSVAQADAQGVLDPAEVAKLIQSNTVAVVMTSASNVCGTCLPIQAVGEICRDHGLAFIVDSAQTAGLICLHMQTMHIDALAFTGHKGLLAPQGVGGFALSDALAQKIAPLVTGGTGSFSHSIQPVSLMPDKFEAGTLALPAIFGLHYALCSQQPNRLQHELALTKLFCELARDLPNVRIIGKQDMHDRVGIVSLDFVDKDNAQVAFALDNTYGIMTRCGLHCAPMAHETLHTAPKGTVRFSFGYANTQEQVRYCIECLASLNACAD